MSKECDEFLSPHRWVMLETAVAFSTLAPGAVLPWRAGDELEREAQWIFDAGGRHIATIDEFCALSDREAAGIAAMIVCAVNTCGGFRSEPACSGEPE